MKSYKKKKDKPGAKTGYRTPSTFRSKSIYSQKGKSQQISKNTSFKVQHKG